MTYLVLPDAKDSVARIHKILVHKRICLHQELAINEQGALDDIR
jgi:hypothetical protein